MEDIPVSWMQRLFARMAACYGNKMSSMYGDCPQADIMDAWREGLSGMPGEKIKRGLERCLTEHPEWPPTLGEFLALCRRPEPAAHRQFVALPAPPRGPIPPEIKAKLDAALKRSKPV